MSWGGIRGLFPVQLPGFTFIAAKSLGNCDNTCTLMNRKFSNEFAVLLGGAILGVVGSDLTKSLPSTGWSTFRPNCCLTSPDSLWVCGSAELVSHHCQGDPNSAIATTEDWDP